MVFVQPIEAHIWWCLYQMVVPLVLSLRHQSKENPVKYNAYKWGMVATVLMCVALRAPDAVIGMATIFLITSWVLTSGMGQETE